MNLCAFVPSWGKKDATKTRSKNEIKHSVLYFVFQK
jgi:hypothetical protein